MEHFFTRIRSKSRDLSERPVVIVAFGDSVTQGGMQKDTLDPKAVYHRLIQDKLEMFYPAATFSTINSGVGGDWADRAQHRLERDVIGYQPDLVLLAFGLNDSCSGVEGMPAFEAAIRRMILEIREKTKSDIILITPPFMASALNARIPPEFLKFAESIISTQSTGMLSQYCEVMRSIATELAVTLADVQAEWIRLDADGVPVNEWFVNGLNHPNCRGHQIAAEVIWHSLLDARTK